MAIGSLLVLSWQSETVDAIDLRGTLTEEAARQAILKLGEYKAAPIVFALPKPPAELRGRWYCDLKGKRFRIDVEDEFGSLHMGGDFERAPGGLWKAQIKFMKGLQRSLGPLGPNPKPPHPPAQQGVIPTVNKPGTERPVNVWHVPAGETEFAHVHDGRTMLTGLERGRHGPPIMRLWDVSTGQSRPSPLPSTYGTTFEPIREDPSLVLVEQPINMEGVRPMTRRLSLWHIESGKELFSCTQDSQVFRYCYAPKAQILALALDKDGRVEWFDVRTGRLLQTLAGYREPMCFSPDGRWFAACQSYLEIRGVARSKFCAEYHVPGLTSQFMQKATCLSWMLISYVSPRPGGCRLPGGHTWRPSTPALR